MAGFMKSAMSYLGMTDVAEGDGISVRRMRAVQPRSIPTIP